MQFTITINQQAIVDGWFEIDLVDAAIVDFLRNYFTVAMTAKKWKGIERIYENDDFFFLVEYSELKKEMPLLKINSNDVIGRRVSKLVKLGLLERSSKKEHSGTKNYFRLGPKYSELVFSHPTEKSGADTDPPDSKVGTHPTEKSGAYIGNSIPNSIPVDTNVSTENTCAELSFSEFWELYPRKDNKKVAETRFDNLPKKALPAVFEGLRKYSAYWKAAGTAREYIPLPSTFIHNEKWNDDIPTNVRQRPTSKPLPKNVLVGERDYSAGTENFQPLTH